MGITGTPTAPAASRKPSSSGGVPQSVRSPLTTIKSGAASAIRSRRSSRTISPVMRYPSAPTWVSVTWASLKVRRSPPGSGTRSKSTSRRGASQPRVERWNSGDSRTPSGTDTHTKRCSPGSISNW